VRMNHAAFAKFHIIADDRVGTHTDSRSEASARRDYSARIDGRNRNARNWGAGFPAVR